MKIIYFHPMRGNPDSGVNKKVLSQVRSLNEAGIPATLYAVTEGKGPDIQESWFSTVSCEELCRPQPGLMRLFYRERKINAILADLISSLSGDDVVYMRIPYPSFFSWQTLRRFRICRIVIEYQTIEPREYQKKRMWGYLVLDLLFGTALRRNPDAIVGVTDEITRYQCRRAGDPDKPHITIGNGFPVNSVPLHTPPVFSGREVRLVCVADINFWHGIDRLLRGMELYRGDVRIILHIAGEGKDIARLQEEVRIRGHEENVVFHGFLSGARLDRLFNESHAAVGSLGIHRLGLNEATTLKAREYCARGIPFVIGYHDPDFPEDFAGCLNIPANENPVDCTAVIDFVNGQYQDPCHPEKIRSFASARIDQLDKMKQLRVFLERTFF